MRLAVLTSGCLYSLLYLLLSHDVLCSVTSSDFKHEAAFLSNYD